MELDEGLAQEDLMQEGKQAEAENRQARASSIWSKGKHIHIKGRVYMRRLVD